MKRKQVRSNKLGLPTVTEYNWGSLYAGTRAQLIAAKLALPEHFAQMAKKKNDGEAEYRLPLNYSDLYNLHVYGGEEGKKKQPYMPLSWDARLLEGYEDKGIYNVSVEYNVLHDMAFRERSETALKLIRQAFDAVVNIAPAPVHESMREEYGIKAKVIERPKL